MKDMPTDEKKEIIKDVPDEIIKDVPDKVVTNVQNGANIDILMEVNENEQTVVDENSGDQGKLSKCL